MRRTTEHRGTRKKAFYHYPKREKGGVFFGKRGRVIYIKGKGGREKERRVPHRGEKQEDKAAPDVKRERKAPCVSSKKESSSGAGGSERKGKREGGEVIPNPDSEQGKKRGGGKDKRALKERRSWRRLLGGGKGEKRKSTCPTTKKR